MSKTATLHSRLSQSGAAATRTGLQAHRSEKRFNWRGARSKMLRCNMSSSRHYSGCMPKRASTQITGRSTSVSTQRSNTSLRIWMLKTNATSSLSKAVGAASGQSIWSLLIWTPSLRSSTLSNRSQASVRTTPARINVAQLIQRKRKKFFVKTSWLSKIKQRELKVARFSKTHSIKRPSSISLT